MFHWFKNFFSASQKGASLGIALDSNGEVLAQNSRSDESISCKHLGDGCLSRDEWGKAAEFYRHALFHNPGYVEAHINLGFALTQQGQFQEAKHHLRQAVSSAPESFDSYYILASISERLGELDEAVEYLKKAVSIKPDFAEALDFLGKLFREQGLLAESVQSYRKALVLKPDIPLIHTGLLLTLQYGTGLTRSELFSEAVRFAEHFEAPVRNLSRPHANIRDPERPLKIGYVSSDFRAHSVALFMIPILANHDKTGIETFCYYNDSFEDEITRQIATLANRFIPCAGMSDEELDRRVRADGIDILVDLNGHTGNHRLLLFARKPAPIQVSYLGYIATTGLSSIDYRLTNLDADPAGNEACYSENLYRFTDHLWWCYRPARNLPEVTTLPALANGCITFVSANNIAKISSENIGMWAEILRSLPTARLVLMAIPPGVAQHAIREKFSVHGIGAERLIFHGKVSLERYRELLLRTDIALDTFPFNGGTTTCETLWLGLPLVTLMGESFVSRMGYALLNDIGLPELAAATPPEYVRIAIELAENVERLSALRQGMRTRLAASPISDEIGFTRSLEAAYRDMWRKYVIAENIQDMD